VTGLLGDWFIGWVILKKRKSTGFLGNGGNWGWILKKKGNDWVGHCLF
jgi:hypothetical protein